MGRGELHPANVIRRVRVVIDVLVDLCCRKDVASPTIHETITATGNLRSLRLIGKTNQEITPHTDTGQSVTGRRVPWPLRIENWYLLASVEYLQT